MKGGEFIAVYSAQELRIIVSDIAKQYGVKKVALFGSYSTGKQTPVSDIDLLIDKGDIKGLFMLNSFILGALSIPGLMRQAKDTERKDKSQSAAEYLGVMLKLGIYPFMPTFLILESSPAEIQTEISSLSIVQAAGIMSLSQQTAASVLRQDRVVIKKHKTAMSISVCLSLSV